MSITGLSCQADYWNRVGPTKPFSHQVDVARFAAVLPRSARILDVGCGYGRTLEAFREAGYHNLFGADISAAMIELARARVPAAGFEILDGSGGLPYDAEAFDVVLLVSVLTCIPTDEGQRALVGEIVRVLRFGGVLFVSDLWMQTDARNIERYERDRQRFGRYGCFRLPEGVVVRHHDREWIDGLLAPFETVTLQVPAAGPQP